MPEERLELLFARFARSGDAADFGAVFDALAPDLLAVARKLAPDRAAAEDLTQTTWLAAIQDAQRFDATRSLKAWLVGILVHKAQLAKRREREAGSGSMPERLAVDAPDEVELRETAELVARALAQLAPSDREVLVPLLLEGKRAVEIARELQKRPDTVHMRVHRGLQRLRNLLATSLGLGLVAAFLDRRALASMKERLIDMTANPTALAPTAAQVVSVPGSLAAGGMLALAKVLLVGACTLAAAAWIVRSAPWKSLGSGAPTAQTVGPESSTAAASSAMITEAPGLASGRFAAPRSGSTIAASEPTTWVLSGAILGLQSGETEPASLAIRSMDPHANYGAPLTASIGPGGSYEVDVTSLYSVAPESRPVSLSLTLDHPRYLVATDQVLTTAAQVVQAGDGTARWELHRDLALDLAAIVTGRVDAPWLPAGTSVSVAAHRMSEDPLNPSWITSSSVQLGAEFRLRLPASSDYSIVALSATSAPRSWLVSAALGEVRALPPALLELGAELSGTVQFGGTVQPGIVVEAWRPGTTDRESLGIIGLAVVWTSAGYERVGGKCTTDAQGRFSIGGFMPGPFELLALGCPEPVNLSFDPAPPTSVTVQAPCADAQVPLQCSMIEFHLTGVNAPPSKVRVIVSKSTDEGAHSETAPIAWSPVQRIVHSPGGAVTISFDIEGYGVESKDYVFPPAGQQTIEYVAFDAEQPASLTVQLSSGGGTEITDAGFGFFQNAADASAPGCTPTAIRNAHIAEAGFDLQGLRPGHHFVRVHCSGSYWRYIGYEMPGPFEVDLVPGGHAAQTLSLPLGGRIRIAVQGQPGDASSKQLVVRDASGTLLNPEVKRYDENGNSGTYSGMVFAGVNDLYPNLPASDYTIEITPFEKPKQVYGVHVVAGETTEVAVNVTGP